MGGRLCEVPFEQVREVRHRKSCAFGFRHLVAPGRVHSEEAFDSRLCLCFEDATLRAHLLAVGVTFDDLVLGELVQCELVLDGGFKPRTLLAWQVLRRYSCGYFEVLKLSRPLILLWCRLMGIMG